MVWGLFKKVVIADSAAQYANAIFGASEGTQGPMLVVGIVAFAIQICGDFSGYSDMDIGLGRLFGLRLKSNFRFPNFSRNVAEFWRRWHISLNTWFRDYVYIPLGGSRGGRWMALRNVTVVFLVSGLWPGADWKFVVWNPCRDVCARLLDGAKPNFMGRMALDPWLQGIGNLCARLFCVDFLSRRFDVTRPSGGRWVGVGVVSWVGRLGCDEVLLEAKG